MSLHHGQATVKSDLTGVISFTKQSLKCSNMEPMTGIEPAYSAWEFDSMRVPSAVHCSCAGCWYCLNDGRPREEPRRSEAAFAFSARGPPRTGWARILAVPRSTPGRVRWPPGPVKRSRCSRRSLLARRREPFQQCEGTCGAPGRGTRIACRVRSAHWSFRVGAQTPHRR